MDRIEHLPTYVIEKRITEVREEIAAVRGDSSIRGQERADLLGDLLGDLSRLRDELEFRTM
jgi:hypothetical protein